MRIIVCYNGLGFVFFLVLFCYVSFDYFEKYLTKLKILYLCINNRVNKYVVCEGKGVGGEIKLTPLTVQHHSLMGRRSKGYLEWYKAWLLYNYYY